MSRTKCTVLALAAVAAIACGDDTTPLDGGEPGADARVPDRDLGPDPADLGSPVEVDASVLPDGGPPGGGCGVAPGDRDREGSLSHDGRTRTFQIHLPPSYDPDTPTPVVLDFHGRNSTSGQQAFLSGMNGKADTEGFIAVHPDGIGQTWNVDFCCGEAMTADVDDVGFVRAMLDALEASYCVDTRRVYATGLSNGGFLSHRLACEVADRIAAVAPVAGTNGTSPCGPGRAVPVFHFHGTADTIVPYDGFGGFASVDATMSGWVGRDGCGAASAEYFTSGEVSCEEWTGCDGAATVRLCTVEGGGHQWPGGFTIPGLGFNTDRISATDAMWDFFQMHSL